MTDAFKRFTREYVQQLNIKLVAASNPLVLGSDHLELLIASGNESNVFLHLAELNDQTNRTLYPKKTFVTELKIKITGFTFNDVWTFRYYPTTKSCSWTRNNSTSGPQTNVDNLDEFLNYVENVATGSATLDRWHINKARIEQEYDKGVEAITIDKAENVDLK